MRNIFNQRQLDINLVHTKVNRCMLLFPEFRGMITELGVDIKHVYSALWLWSNNPDGDYNLCCDVEYTMLYDLLVRWDGLQEKRWEVKNDSVD